LNTNSPQTIDQIDSTLRLDREFRGGDRVSASYAISRQKIDAFQLVAGQNPDTEIHNTRAHLAYQHVFSDVTSGRFSAAVQRSMSDLRAEPHAAPSLVKTANQLADLLPEVQFPIHRALNTFQWGAVFSHRAAGGRHVLTWGADAARYQMNGVESANARGAFTFANDALHSAVDNLRLGLPITYEVTIGPMDRGFRNLSADIFAADQWGIGSRLQLYYGLRYSLVTAPTEVNHLNQFPYGCDCNNFSPRFSFAYRLPAAWTLRTGYTVSFGQIYPVTYGQVRFNEPLAHRIQVQSPNLVDPLRGINFNDPNTRQLPTRLSPDLVSPYSHQYNFTLERRFGTAGSATYLLRLGYVGSRTFKPLEAHINNRAVPVPGIPLTLATVDQRRADPRYVDVRNIVNGGAAYLDAAQVSLQAPPRRGLVWGLTYTFGKALDTGSDYAGTAANTELTKSRPQSQFDSYRDRKGLSNFDSTHALMLYYAYDLPGRFTWLLRNWRISGAALAKTGTPFTIAVGSDNPGFGNVDGGTSDRPNLLDPSILGMTVGDPDTSASILRRDRFSYIALGESRGNLARNALRKGGIVNFNAALARELHWRGSGDRAVLLRGEVFNLTNHPQFDEPQRTLTGSSFGKITNTLNDGRVLQLSVRFQF
ncbi:MAG: TonB-dependent receptor, partial [Candidatus Solibacter sp.]|nr:TonB-dependent receptor [Candidatus Solibacter sp.]